MTLSVPGVPVSCEKFPHSSQLNFWSTESMFNQFSVFLKTLNALCVCLQYRHPRSIKRVIRSDKPVTLLLLLWSHKCNFGAEPRSRIIATSAVKGLIHPQTPMPYLRGGWSHNTDTSKPVANATNNMVTHQKMCSENWGIKPWNESQTQTTTLPGSQTLPHSIWSPTFIQITRSSAACSYCFSTKTKEDCWRRFSAGCVWCINPPVVIRQTSFFRRLLNPFTVSC
jgi:hypothetical protein